MFPSSQKVKIMPRWHHYNFNAEKKLKTSSVTLLNRGEGLDLPSPVVRVQPAGWAHQKAPQQCWKAETLEREHSSIKESRWGLCGENNKEMNIISLDVCTWAEGCTQHVDVEFRSTKLIKQQGRLFSVSIQPWMFQHQETTRLVVLIENPWVNISAASTIPCSLNEVLIPFLTTNVLKSMCHFPLQPPVAVTSIWLPLNTPALGKQQNTLFCTWNNQMWMWTASSSVWATYLL